MHSLQISLWDGKAMGELGDCPALRRLQLHRWRVLYIGGSYMSVPCPSLAEVELEQLSELAARSVLAGGAGKAAGAGGDGREGGLRSLTVRSCHLGLFDYWFVHWLAHNQRLQHLDLTNNEFTDVVDIVKAVGPVERLVLDQNPLRSYCEQWSDEREPPRAAELSLRGVGLSRLCFRAHTHLRNLTLQNNNISMLQWEELPRVGEARLLVDLRGNPLQLRADCDEQPCAATLVPANISNVDIQLDLSLDCDCQLGCFATQLRDLQRSNVSVSGAMCAAEGAVEKRQLYEMPPEEIECVRWACGACVCRRAWGDAVTAECRGRALRRVPAAAVAPGVVALLAADNRIDTLQETDLPDSLKLVDLRNNTVLSLSARAARRLFAAQRTLLLAGTAVRCDCAALPWLQALAKHRRMVPDYESIRCEGPSGALLSATRLDRLCAAPGGPAAWAAPLAAALALSLAALTAFLYRRLHLRVKVFLFARGWCLSCVTELDADPDRDYDAFFSFCHQDDEFVTESILPQLGAYSLCIHYRDWAAGGWIPAQIASSVQRSRRTIILLTQEFLDSQWSLLEFRMAHAMTLEEKRSRIIVLVKGDVLSDERIDAELRSYLATNTYIKWGDPWFFDKLRYALPARAQAAHAPPPLRLHDLRLAIQTYSDDAAPTTNTQ